MMGQFVVTYIISAGNLTRAHARSANTSAHEESFYVCVCECVKQILYMQCCQTILAEAEFRFQQDALHVSKA